MRFAQLNISILQGCAMADFSIVLLKIIPVSCVHWNYTYIQKHAQSSLFCENENLVR